MKAAAGAIVAVALPVALPALPALGHTRVADPDNQGLVQWCHMNGAWSATWDCVLTDAELRALNKGACPRSVRPDKIVSLIDYRPAR